MAETNNAISLLVQLGVDTASSKTNLNTQIKQLSEQLEKLDIKVDIDKDAIKALNDLSKIDLKGLSETIKGAGKGVSGLGGQAEKAGDEIKKSFADVQKTLDATFGHLSKDFQEAMGKGIVSIDDLKKAFKGMEASFNMDFEVVGEDDAGTQIRRIKAIEATFKNLEGQIERVKFDQSARIQMPDGSEQPLWLPSDTSKVVDSQMKQIEQSIAKASRSAQNELTKLHNSGKITSEQFKEMSLQAQKFGNASDISIYNQKLSETVANNRSITKEKKEQFAVEEKIRKLQNSIIAAQNRDPKGMGSDSAVSGMLNTLKEIDPASKGASEAVKGVSDSFDRLKAEATQAGRESMSVMDSFKVAMEKFPVWMAASTIFFQSVRSIGDSIRQIIELDTQMTVLRRVAGDGVDANNVMQESIRLAGELGNKISEVNEGFIAFARQGFKGDELTMLAEYATLLGNISDLSVDDSASILTAALKAFNMETERGIHVVNALNEVDNNYSVTTQQLSESMQRAAGTASVYGSSLERLIGYTTAIAEITRESGSVIGNSLKSIFSRITSVNGAINALEDIGISVKTDSGEMREVDAILDDLGAQWKDLNAEQQQNIGLQVAGRYQLSRFLVLMNQYDQALAAANTATNSAGSGYRENAEYLKSYEAQINMVKNAWTEAIIAMRDSGLGDAMILGLNVGLEFFKALTSIIEKVGLLPALLGAGGAAFLLFNDGARKATMSNGAFLAGLLKTPSAINGMNASLVTATGLMRAKTFATNTLTASLRTLGTFLSGAFLPIAGFMLLGTVISKATEAVTEHIKEQKELKKAIEDSIDKGVESVSTNKQQVDELIATYKSLSEEKEKGEWNLENEEKYLAVQQELSELFPTLIDHVDEKGQAHLKSSEEIDKEVASMEHLLDLKRQDALENAKDTYAERLKPLQKYRDEVEKIEKELINRRKSLAEFDPSAYGHDEEEGRRIIELAESQIRELEARKIYAETMLASAAQSMTQEVRGLYETFLSMLSQDIVPQIQNELGNLFSNINWSSKTKEEIEEVQQTLSNFAIQLSNAFQSGNSAAYDETIANLLTYLQQELGMTAEEVENLLKSYESMSQTIQNDEVLAKLASDAEAAEEGFEDLADATDKVDDKIKDLTSSISYINGVLEDYSESNQLSSATMMELIDKYPELIAHINNEAELIEALEGIRNADIDAARQQLAEKLSSSEEFYNGNLSLIEQFVSEQFKFYKGDLSEWKTLAQAKLDVETELINTLAKQWGVYYNQLSKMFEVPLQAAKHSFHIPGLDPEEDKKAAANAKALDNMIAANRELSKFRDTWNNFTLGQVSIDFNKIGTSLDKATSSTKGKTKAQKDANKAQKDAAKAHKEANDAMEQSIFIADKYKRALEELNLEIKKQQERQSRFPEYSTQYNNALEKEIKLQRDKMKLLQEQEKSLQAQIKAGNIIQTGVVTVKTGGGTVKPSGFGGRITSQFGMRWGRMHEGIDIASPRGTRLDSNVSGNVIRAEKHKTYGNMVRIQDATGKTHTYAHLDKIAVRVGQKVAEGMQIGTIGSTGRSTGPHLHYEVRDASGKPINPASYVEQARKGISTASKEVAQVHQQIDNAQSEIINLQGQMIDQENLLFQLEAKSIEARLSLFDRKRLQNQQIIDYELAKLKDVDEASERYGLTLDKVSRHLDAKQRVNREELEALEELIRKGGYTGNTLLMLKDRVWALKTEMFDLNNEIQNIDLERLNLVMGKHDDIISDIVYEYQRAEAIMALYEEGTADYNEQLSISIELQKQHRDAVKAKIEALQQEIITGQLSAEVVKANKKEIQDLTIEYWRLAGAVINSEKSLEASRKKLAEEAADAMVNAYKAYLSEKRDMVMRSYDDEMRAEDKRHKQVMDNYRDELDAFRKIIQERIDAIDKEESERNYAKEIDKLEEERLKVLGRLNLLSMDDSLEAKAERKKLNEDLARIEEDLFEKRHAKEVADRKDNLNEMLKDKEEQIQKEEKAANEQHEAVKDRIEKERKYWEQFYTDQLNDERKFAKMKEDIVAGNFEKMSEEFQAYIKEMEDTMPELLDTLDGTMEAVGTSIRLNIIDTLREALDLLAQVDSNNVASKNPAPGGTGSLGTGAGGSLGSSIDQSVSTLSAADLQVLTGKFYNDRLAHHESNPVRKAKIKEKAYELAESGRSSGSSISASKGFDAIISELSQADREALGKHLAGSGSQHVSTPALQDFIKRFGQQLINSSIKLNTGGYVQKGANGLAMLHEEEVVLNKKETKDFFKFAPILEQLHKMLSPLALPSVQNPKLSGAGGNEYNFTFHVDKMTGSKQDADNFMQEINDRLKRNKGMR